MSTPRPIFPSVHSTVEVMHGVLRLSFISDIRKRDKDGVWRFITRTGSHGIEPTGVEFSSSLSLSAHKMFTNECIVAALTSDESAWVVDPDQRSTEEIHWDQFGRSLLLGSPKNKPFPKKPVIYASAYKTEMDFHVDDIHTPFVMIDGMFLPVNKKDVGKDIFDFKVLYIHKKEE